MTGEKDLAVLLTSMAPELMDGEYVFVTLPDARYGDYAELEPLVSIMEPEGLTLVISSQQADAHAMGYESTYRGITLKIHSSLDAVGLTAAFAKQLTDHRVSANVVAGFYHDHIFVNANDAHRAMKALSELAQPVD